MKVSEKNDQQSTSIIAELHCGAVSGSARTRCLFYRLRSVFTACSRLTCRSPALVHAAARSAATTQQQGGQRLFQIDSLLV
jgi:hypothetical protein